MSPTIQHKQRLCKRAMRVQEAGLLHSSAIRQPTDLTTVKYMYSINQKLRPLQPKQHGLAVASLLSEEGKTVK